MRYAPGFPLCTNSNPTDGAEYRPYAAFCFRTERENARKQNMTYISVFRETGCRTLRRAMVVEEQGVTETRLIERLSYDRLSRYNCSFRELPRRFNVSVALVYSL